MRQVKKLGSALTFAAFLATAMIVSTTPLDASGFGSGGSKPFLCHLLAAAEQAISGLPDSHIKTTLLQLIDSRQSELGCG